MNPRRGWNPDLEESYLLNYSEYEVEIFTKCTKRIFLGLIKISASEPSPISCYKESSRITRFSPLRFSDMKP